MSTFLHLLATYPLQPGSQRQWTQYSATCSARQQEIPPAEGLKPLQYRVLQNPRSTSRHITRARRGRGLEDDVELDDAGDWNTGDLSLGNLSGSLSGAARQAWRTVNSFADRLVDLSLDFLPDSISRPVADTAVRAGLVLGVITIVRGVLGSILLFGTIILALYVGIRMLGTDSRGGSDDRPAGARHRSSSQRRGLPSGKASNSDLMDVWFERQDQDSVASRQRR